MKPICKLILCGLLCGSQFSTSLAQKLPDVQKEGLRPPATVKIDGKLDEWGSLSAYSKRIVAYYSIANDDENLYLIIKSDNSLITSKILHGGLTFTVSTSGRNEKDAVAITFPVVGDKEIQTIHKSLPPGISDDTHMSVNQRKQILAQRETAMAEANRKSINIFKFIKVEGIRAIVDKQLPIYNDHGIQVAAAMNVERAFNYELALPIKYLDLPLPTSAIHYNIKLLGKHVPAGLVLMPIKTQDGGPPLGEGGVDLRSLMVATDFWGEYVLKK